MFNISVILCYIQLIMIKKHALIQTKRFVKFREIVLGLIDRIDIRA